MSSEKSVLIVEDESIFALLLEMRFKKAGFTVTETCATGEEAVASAFDKNPDFVIMDIRLSGAMDGIEAADQIMSKVHSKIIFLTGYSNEDIVDRANQLRPFAFFTKPVDLDKLISTMRN